MSSGHRLRDVEQQHPLLDREEAHCSSHSEASTRLWFIQDCCGMVCAFITWYLVFFADFVVTFVMLLPSRSFWYAVVNGVIFNSLAVLALASHLRTMLTDPGAVPRGNATRKHMESLQLKPGEVVYKCPKCCSIKPERAHHCSICQRCIRKMDHHCPWVNNCVGEKNQRFFVLFTMYIAMISGHALALCGYHFITCIRVQWGECSDFSPPVTMLLLIFLCMEALLFLTFTAVMFSTQLHSICNDQTGLVQAGPLTEPHPNITDQELFWGSDQYDFAVGLRASGMECFWHFAHKGETFYLNFMVQWVTGVGHDRHLSVHVNAPSGLLEANVDDAQGQINFEAKETGFYQMCFSNFHNRFGTMQIFLSFGVYYDSFQDPSERREEEKKKKEEVSKDLNNTLSIIEASCHKVENQVFHMFRFYGFSRMRKSADYYLLRSNSQYISWWSTALSLLIVTSGYLQLLFLKRLFVTKTGNEEEKPRC